MRILSNFDKFKEYCDIDSKVFFHLEVPPKSIGLYKIIEYIFSAIFVVNYKLFFVYNTDEYEITNNYHLKISRTNKKYQKNAELYEDDTLMLEFIYEWEKSYSEYPEFGMTDDQDFDWGLFLSNIINNKEGKETFIRVAMGDDL